MAFQLKNISQRKLYQCLQFHLKSIPGKAARFALHSETHSPNEIVRAFSTEADRIQEKRKLRKLKKEARKALHLQRQIIHQDKSSLSQKQTVYESNTSPGEKKDISGALPDTYSPQYVEAAWYDWWEKQGYFAPLEDVVDKERFVMVLPPPNVTGTLHLGHALGNSIQDAVARWHRMLGHDVLWNPGCDHAGIATQTVIEKNLWRKGGVNRHDIGRDAFTKEVWKWKEQKGDQIYKQMRRLGSSLDWSRECFTLDPKLSYAVSEAFIKLHDEGFIYRDNRLVNWSCALQSAISDIEVDNEALDGKTDLDVPGYVQKVTFGELTFFAYPLENSDQEIVVATTRPETMLGDTGIAVHPEDSRYATLHGQYALHPITGRRLPVIFDSFVDREFGTGAVKITPAHDQTDYTTGCSHNLDVLDVIDDHGNMQNVPEQFMGMGRFAARLAVVDALRQRGVFKETKSHAMTVPRCSRTGDIIEPRLKKQWFMNCDNMAKEAIRVVENGQLQLIPSHYTNHWHEWLNNIRDWCISRQLWWGHRIPAYKIYSIDGEPLQLNGSDIWVSAHSQEEAVSKARLHLAQPEISARQDEDVLDTWFSSAIFPFSIFGWPHQTTDLAKFYPTHLLETASDIMFFWVARMVMMGTHLTGHVPFKQVLFHSIIRDSQGRKMSKSLGNVIDPMNIINGISLQDLQKQLEGSNLDSTEVKKASNNLRKEFPLGIAECGADALRFSFCSYNFKGHFVNVDITHIKRNRHFCNKIWQAFRFVSKAIGDDFVPDPDFQLSDAHSDVDKWIVSRLSRLVSSCQDGFSDYSLTSVTSALVNFWWAEFCDVYLECIKPILLTGTAAEKEAVREILYLCVDTGLRALAPFMPFLSEELYQRLPRNVNQNVESVSVAEYPTPNQYAWQNEQVEADMNNVRKIVSQALSLRREFNLTKNRANVYLEPSSIDLRYLMTTYRPAIKVLSRSNEVILLDTEEDTPIKGVFVEVDNVCKLHMELEGVVEVEDELTKALAQKQRFRTELKELKARITRSSYDSEKAIVASEKAKEVESRLKRVERQINVLESLR